MAKLTQFLEAIQQLSAEELQQLRSLIDQQEQQQPLKQDTPRILGLHAHLGAAWMSDDFTAEFSITN